MMRDCHETPNQAVQPTGVSWLAQRRSEPHRRLAPVADLLDIFAMKSFAPLLLLVSCVTVFAIGSEYSSLRNWVEKRSTEDKTPVAERVFVNFSWKDSAIVRHKSSMTLQEVIGKTQFR